MAASGLVVLGIFGGLAADVGRPYPGFLATPDYRVAWLEPDARAAGLEVGDRIVAVDGGSPLTLLARARRSPAPVRYQVERAGTRREAALAPRPFGWSHVLGRFGVYFLVSSLMLLFGVFVYTQNPAGAPNRNFLVYMCLWAVSNVAVPEAVLGTRKYAAILVSFVPPLLSVHGWIYDISDGLLRDLNFTVSSDQQTMDAYEAAVAALSP